MASPANPQGRNWARESRRRAPARLANAYLSPSGAAPAITPHGRHPVLKQISRRNVDLSDRNLSAAFIQQQQTRLEKVTVAEELEEDMAEVLSPVTERSKITLVSTADLGLEDYDSDSSYNSFKLSLEKDLFSPEPTQCLSPKDHRVRPQSSTSNRDHAKSSADRDHFVAVYRVYRSCFRGDDFQDGNLSAELKVGTNRKLFQRELSKPLFRWAHVENPTMNFSTFVPIVLECPWLDAFEKEKLANILKSARQKSERSLRRSQGEKSNYLEPEYYEETIEEMIYPNFRSRRRKIENLRWLCIPYLALKDMVVAANVTVEHPEFEKITAFLQSGYVAEGKHFQVAQLWVLMLGDTSIITCSRRAISDIPGNLIRIKTLPPPESEESREAGDRVPVIFVSDGGIRKWLLPVENCRSWPEFTANLAELSIDFANGWDLMYEQVKIKRTDWPRVISLAQKTSVRLVLKPQEGDEDSDEDAPLAPSSNGSDSEDEVEAGETNGNHNIVMKKSAKESSSNMPSTLRSMLER